jgi:hypothetical protein
VQDYVYYIGAAKQASKQASNYVVITKYLLNHIQKTYTFGDDIASALEMKIPMDFAKLVPQIQVSMSKDADEKAREVKELRNSEAEIASFVQ